MMDFPEGKRDTTGYSVAVNGVIKRNWREGTSVYRALQNAYDDDFIEAKETCWKKCYCDAAVYLCVRSLINSSNSRPPRGSSLIFHDHRRPLPQSDSRFTLIAK